MKVLVFALLTLLFASPVFATDASFSASYSAQMNPTGNDIGVSKITPASAIYFLKTIREAIEFKLALTPRVKALRELEFATRRLREVKSLISLNHQDLIQETLERYYAHLQYMSELGVQDSEIETRLKESLTIHLEVLEQIYPQLTDKSARLAVRSAVNRIVQKRDLSPFALIPACNFLSKEATSSGINQSEQAILAERAETCRLQLH